MELIFDETQPYLDDIASLTPEEFGVLAQRIDTVGLLAFSDYQAYEREVYQPYPITLHRGYGSSLRALPATPSLTVLLSADEDPIFDQFLVTLYRAVKHEDVEQAFGEIAALLYYWLPDAAKNFRPS